MSIDNFWVQFGFAGFFAVGIFIVSLKFYQHMEGEISYLRGKVDSLEAQVKELMKPANIKQDEDKV